MQTLGRRAKDRPALGWMPLFCVFCVWLSPPIHGGSLHQWRSSAQLSLCLSVEPGPLCPCISPWPSLPGRSASSTPAPAPPAAGWRSCDRAASPRPGRCATAAGCGGQPGSARVPPRPGVACHPNAGRAPAGRSGSGGEAGRRPRLPHPRRCPEPAGVAGAGVGRLAPADRGPAEPTGRRNPPPRHPRRRPGPAAPPAHRPDRQPWCCHPRCCHFQHARRISAPRRWGHHQRPYNLRTPHRPFQTSHGAFSIRRCSHRISPSVRPCSFRHQHPNRRGYGLCNRSGRHGSGPRPVGRHTQRSSHPCNRRG